MTDLHSIVDAVKKGRAKLVKQLIPEALESGMKASDILENGLLAGMSEVGERFRKEDIFIPEVLVAARAMKAGTEILKPYLVDSEVRTKGVVVIGTVQGDLHDIGKNLVSIMMEGAGLTVVDLGVDVTAEQFVDAVKIHNADIVAMSSLLATTMGSMKTVIDELTSAGIRDRVKVMVGGAPVNQEFADQIGADAYSPNASAAAQRAIELLA